MLTWINTPTPLSEKFLFLDRDGVINVDRSDYVKSWEEFRFHPDALEALRWLREHSVNVIIASNQSALNRGLMTWEDFLRLHTLMNKTIEESGGMILAAFYCPHRPDERCGCRKPSPGMILAARQLYGIPSQNVYFIGDKPSDIQAAANGDCRGILLDRTRALDEALDVVSPPPDADVPQFSTLAGAVKALFAS